LLLQALELEAQRSSLVKNDYSRSISKVEDTS